MRGWQDKPSSRKLASLQLIFWLAEPQSLIKPISKYSPAGIKIQNETDIDIDPIATSEVIAKNRANRLLDL